MKTSIRISVFFLCLLTGLNQISFGQCATAKYAGLPYTQDFESWITLCDNVDSLNVPDSSWINTPVTGDYSWRRDDQSSAGSWDCGTCGLWYSPYNNNGTEAYHGNHSAAFNDYDACGGGTTGNLNLYVDCSSVTGTKELSFYFINPESGSELDVYVSTDGGTTFGSSLISCDTPTNSNNWAHYVVPITSNSATTVISFQATSDCGFYDMGLDYVQLLTPCQGTPIAGSNLSNKNVLVNRLRFRVVRRQEVCPIPGNNPVMELAGAVLQGTHRPV